MNEQEKVALLAAGRIRCLLPLENILEQAIQKQAFQSAECWRYEYNGALKMLEALRLITGKEYDARSEERLSRLLRAKNPRAYEEEAV